MTCALFTRARSLIPPPNSVGERIKIWLAFVFVRRFIIAGADVLALSRTGGDFHSARAFVRKDVFRPPKLRGLQVPPVTGDTARSMERGRLSHGGWQRRGIRPASLGSCFREKCSDFYRYSVSPRGSGPLGVCVFLRSRRLTTKGDVEENKISPVRLPALAGKWISIKINCKCISRVCEIVIFWQ